MILTPVSRPVELKPSNHFANKVGLGDRAAHEWYRFILSFPPHLVRDYLRRFDVGKKQLVLDPFCGTATTMVAALKHGRNSIGVELDTEYCKMAASRLLNENSSLFGHAQFQIELKPHPAVEAVAVLQEKATAYKTPTTGKDSKRLTKSIAGRGRKT